MVAVGYYVEQSIAMTMAVVAVVLSSLQLAVERKFETVGRLKSHFHRIALLASILTAIRASDPRGINGWLHWGLLHQFLSNNVTALLFCATTLVVYYQLASLSAMVETSAAKRVGQTAVCLTVG